jgi:peptidoglycan/xylan/chitin deacetylase (PgdA/CDA1 family)
MRVAGIAWRDEGYEVVIADECVLAAPTGSPGRRLAALRQDLVDIGDVRCVVDSTSGALDGYLMAAGLAVYRADPWSLPDRPPHGSVSARALAELGRRDPDALTRLRPGIGSLAGRSDEYLRHIADCAGVEYELARSGRLVVRAAGRRPEVALTFDDGPDPAFTPRVLDILREHGARATFFLVGLNANAYPELVERIVAEGHGVGNHTWSHPYLPDLSRDEVLRQLDATGAAIGKVTGDPPGLMRPPYGSRTPDVLRWIRGQQLTTVLWDIDVGDWAAPPAADIVAGVTAAAKAGSIVLMHDAGGDRTGTVAALPPILADFAERGLTSVPVCELTR